ncbi:MAG: hypothetical protein CMM99_04915 [Rickettsiales bacterium]|nr:hypothetical protein [Rickettsiales bacterium]
MYNNTKHWNIFYQKNNLKKKTSFAQFVIKNTFSKNSIIDIGCGTGRDAFYYSNFFKKVYALDKSKVVISLNKKKNKFFKNKVFFFQKNIASKNLIYKKKFENICARFFLHTLTEEEEKIFFLNIKKIVKKNNLIFFEFRTIKDNLMKKGKKLSKYERVYGHYRRFINTVDLKKKLKNYNFKILYESQSKNFSIFRNQKPHLARFILKA